MKSSRTGTNSPNNKSIKNLCVLYFYAQSIVNKMNEFHCVVNDIFPDIICICEAWSKEEITDAFFNIPEYSIVSRADQSDT